MGGEEDDDPGWHHDHLDFLLHVVEIRGLRL